MIRKKVPGYRMPVIDLSGPDGNSFVLLGMAKGWAKDLGLDFAPILEEATSGDYENLLLVLDNYFGDLVIFER